MKNRLFKYSVLAAGALSTFGGMARADDLLTSLESSASTAVTAGIATIGVVLLAGIAKPVAIKAYGIVRQAIAKF